MMTSTSTPSAMVRMDCWSSGRVALVGERRLRAGVSCRDTHQTFTELIAVPVSRLFALLTAPSAAHQCVRTSRFTDWYTVWYGVCVPETTARLSVAERLRLIEQAATRLFAERGFAATTVEDIVRAAGLTKPMLYRHFESKQELCVALLEKARANLIAAPLARLKPGAPDSHQQVPVMIEAWLAHVQQHSDEARLLFTPITGDPEVEQTQRRLHDLQTATQIALLRELAPGIDEVEAKAIANLMRASLSATALWWLDRPQVPLQVPARALLRAFHGIFATVDHPWLGHLEAEQQSITSQPPGGLT